MKLNEAVFRVRDYDLAATLGCGQAFRWEMRDGRWQGVVGDNWVALEQRGHSLSPAEGERVGPLARSSRRLGEVRGDAWFTHAGGAVTATKPTPHPNPLPLGGGEGMAALFQRHQIVTHDTLPAAIAHFPPKRLAATQRRGEVVVTNTKNGFVQLHRRFRHSKIRR